MEEDLVEIANAFETTEFSPVELVAIKRTRRRDRDRRGSAERRASRRPETCRMVRDLRLIERVWEAWAVESGFPRQEMEEMWGRWTAANEAARRWRRCGG